MAIHSVICVGGVVVGVGVIHSVICGGCGWWLVWGVAIHSVICVGEWWLVGGVGGNI